MHVLQFNHWHKARFSSRLLKSILLGLLCTLFFLFNPSLSYADTQAVQNGVSIKNTETPNRPVWLVMGDSLSAAYGIELEQGWVSLLQARYPLVEVVNASISGETTSAGKQRIAPLLKQHKPNVLVIELGANDALRGQNLKISQQNIQTMIESCSHYNPNCKIVLLGVKLPTNYGPAYDAMFQKMYQNLADKNDVLFDPFFLETVALEPGFMQRDGLHPNAEAQPFILQRVQGLFDVLYKLDE